ncbi:hypothetical protein QP371_07485, partial [Gardnerella swidsinskii]|nr:hypothetical protein [Gardnerella swidsinskii]
MGIDEILTNKQQQVLDSYLHDDWKFLILTGAFRAGKTIMNNYLFIMELKRIARLSIQRKDPHPQY